MTRFRRRLLALVSALAVVLTSFLGAATLAPSAAAAGYQPPGFLRSVGGSGEAMVYAWGMEYNPVTNEILVGDYWNFQVRRYDLDGTYKGSFFRAANLRKGQPYTIAVDPGNGDIYVAELSDGLPRGYFGVYDKYGTYLREIRVSGSYPVWVSISPNREMWVADAHNTTSPVVRRVRLSDGATLSSFGTYGTTAGRLGRELHGVDVDSAGNVYVADAANRRVSVFTSGGSYLRTIGGPGTGAGQFAGDLRGLSVDRVNNRVFVVDAAGSEVDVFTTSGTYLRSIGSEGFGPGQFADGGRECALDGSGNLWVADYGAYRFERFSPEGVFMGAYPDPPAGPIQGGFSQNRDVAVAADSTIWSADSWNNRFLRHAPNGAVLGQWGYRNSSAPYGMNYPRGIGIDPQTGRIWVVVTRDHFIRVYEPDGTYVMTVGSSLDSGNPGSFRWPLDIEFARGKAYISDYVSGYVKVVRTSDGAELTRLSVTNSGLAVDEASSTLYVISWQNRRVSMYNLDSLAYKGSFGSSGSGPSQFTNPWDGVVAGGTLWITDAKQGQVKAFTTSGAFLGAFGSNGKGAYQFSSPSGISADAAGNLYVADAGNDRVQVFSTTTPPGTSDTQAPSAAVTTPANAVFPAVSAAWVEGSYTDDTRISTVEVALRDRDTGLYWNPRLSAWQTTRSFYAAHLVGSETSGTWRFPFVNTKPGTRLYVQARAVDERGNVQGGTIPSINVSIDTSPAPDVQPPLLRITSPGVNATVSAPVTLTGMVSDLVANGSVDVAIRNTSTGEWWNDADGAWGTTQQWAPAAQATPATKGSTWSLPFSGATPGTTYFATVRSTDAAGNAAERVSVTFTVQ